MNEFPSVGFYCQKVLFMSATQNVPSVWPGYVAAIASLVLSLLLLLAILVFALTQVGNLVSAYMQELLRDSLKAEQTYPKSSAKGGSQSQRLPGPPPELSQEAVGPGTPMRQLRLIFAAELADIPANQMGELVASIKQMQAPEDANWLIWSDVLSSDTVMERSAYRLMLVVRKALMTQGVSEKQIELQIKTTKTLPLRYSQGEIVIYVAPLHVKSTEKMLP